MSSCETPNQNRNLCKALAIALVIWLVSFVPVAIRLRSMTADPSGFDSHPYVILLVITLFSSIISLLTIVAILCWRRILLGLSLVVLGFGAVLTIDSQALKMPAWRIFEQVLAGLATVGTLVVVLLVLRLIGFRFRIGSNHRGQDDARYPLADYLTFIGSTAFAVHAVRISELRWQTDIMASSFYLVGMGLCLSILSVCTLFATAGKLRWWGLLMMVGVLFIGYSLASTATTPLSFSPWWYVALFSSHTAILACLLTIFRTQGFRHFRLLAADLTVEAMSDVTAKRPEAPSI